MIFFLRLPALLFFAAAAPLLADIKSEPISPVGIAENQSAQSNARFIPPDGWRFADAKSLPPHVHVMVVGKGKGSFPPSINLGTEAFSGTLKEYLKVVKAINDNHGAEWRDLGSIPTESGEASLSQVDSKTEWGDIRMMHVILLKSGIVYILTVAALKDEFSSYYSDFFKSMKSLEVGK